MMDSEARKEFHRRHNAAVVAEEGGGYRWTCTCGARGQQERDAYRSWQGYYAHVTRAGKKEGY